MAEATRDTHDSTGEDTTVGPDATEYERYAATMLEDEQLLVCDRDDENDRVKTGPPDP